LLLLPGFGATAIWQWHPQIKALAQQHQLIVPDLLFFGESRSRRAERSLDAQAQAMRQLLDSLNIDKAHVLGLSYGGFVAYTLAARWPERVQRLILNNSPGPVIGRPEVESLLRKFQVDRIQDLFIPREFEGLRRLLQLGWHKAPMVPGWILADAHRVLFRDQVEEKYELLTQLLGLIDSPEERLPLSEPGAIQSPTLILWGAHDPVFPLHLAHRLHRHLGRLASLKIVAGAAHAPNLEKPRDFNRYVLNFLSQSAA
jgi:pimeloyl-ACP methyl ester carboxylesterase